MRVGRRKIFSFFNGRRSIYDHEAENYFAAAGITNVDEKTIVNNFFLDLKRASIFTKIKMMGIGSPTSSTAARVDAIRLTTMTLGGAPTWNGDGSWSFDAIDDYIDTGFDANAAGMSNSSIGMFCSNKNDYVVPATHCMMGSRSGATNDFIMYFTAGPNFTARNLKADSAVTAACSGGTVFHNYQSHRTSGVLHTAYEDITSLGSSATLNTNTVPTGNVYVGCANQSGTPGLFSNITTTVFAVTTGLNSTEAAALEDAVYNLDIQLGRY